MEKSLTGAETRVAGTAQTQQQLIKGGKEKGIKPIPPTPDTLIHLPVAIPQRVRRKHRGVPIPIQLEAQLASVQCQGSSFLGKAKATTGHGHLGGRGEREGGRERGREGGREGGLGLVSIQGQRSAFFGETETTTRHGHLGG